MKLEVMKLAGFLLLGAGALFNLLCDTPRCFPEWYKCWEIAQKPRTDCVEECWRVFEPDVGEAEAACRVAEVECEQRRFVSCLSGPYDSNMPIQVCLEIEVPPMTLCWTEYTGLGVPAVCRPADWDGDGDVDLYDFSRYARAPRPGG